MRPTVVSRLKQGALSLWYGEHGMPCVVNGLELRCDPRHRFFPEHDPGASALVRSRIAPDAVSLNVGANVGVHALQLAMWAVRGRVFAFEPGPAAARILRRHVRMNGLEGRIEVVEAAVGSTPGHATLFTDGADVMGRLEAPNPLVRDSARPVTVSVTSLDAFCEARSIPPDWIVMDIEGFEIAALRGGHRLLGDPGVEFVVEMHPSIWSSSEGASRSELEEILRRASRAPVPLSGQSDPLAEHGMVHLAVQERSARGV